MWGEVLGLVNFYKLSGELSCRQCVRECHHQPTIPHLHPPLTHLTTIRCYSPTYLQLNPPHLFTGNVDLWWQVVKLFIWLVPMWWLFTGKGIDLYLQIARFCQVVIVKEFALCYKTMFHWAFVHQEEGGLQISKMFLVTMF